MQKYSVFYIDQLGYKGPVLSEADTYGDWYRASEVDAELQAAREMMRELWRLEPSELPPTDLANRCKAFMGGG